MIFTTAYTSSMVPSMRDPDLVDLLVKSRARNAERGVTGLLLFRRGRVLQILEGNEQVVRSLYDRIRMDVRHQHVTNVWASKATQRRFPDWTMGFEDLDGTDHAVPTGKSLTSSNPASRSQAGSDVARHNRAVHDEDRSSWTPNLLLSASDEQQEDYLRRRQVALRRALVSGDRLTGSLGIILNGHEPVPASNGLAGLHCRECRTYDEPALDAYPCPTAKNALWALEAVTPR